MDEILTHDIITVDTGELQIATGDKVLRAVLGSCVGVILYDKKNKIAGLAHVFLPEKSYSKLNKPITAYANTAIPILKKRIIAKGANKTNIIAYLVGGNNLLKDRNNKPSAYDGGLENLKACKEALKKENISPIIVFETNRQNGCTAYFKVKNGDLMVKEHKSIMEI